MRQLEYQEQQRRRGSMVEPLTAANEQFIVNNKQFIASTQQKLVKVRTPRRGRSKSIVILDSREKPRNFPIGRLNNYDKQMKKHRGPLSLMSELESIDEISLSDKLGEYSQPEEEGAPKEFAQNDH